MKRTASWWLKKRSCKLATRFKIFWFGWYIRSSICYAIVYLVWLEYLKLVSYGSVFLSLVLICSWVVASIVWIMIEACLIIWQNGNTKFPSYYDWALLWACTICEPFEYKTWKWKICAQFAHNQRRPIPIIWAKEAEHKFWRLNKKIKWSTTKSRMRSDFGIPRNEQSELLGKWTIRITGQTKARKTKSRRDNFQEMDLCSQETLCPQEPSQWFLQVNFGSSSLKTCVWNLRVCATSY